MNNNKIEIKSFIGLEELLDATYNLIEKSNGNEFNERMADKLQSMANSVRHKIKQQEKINKKNEKYSKCLHNVQLINDGFDKNNIYELIKNHPIMGPIWKQKMEEIKEWRKNEFL